MIDTDKSEIPWYSWREMKNHTPFGPEWSMLYAQNFQDVPFNRRERYQKGVVGCVIEFHLPDSRWDDNEAEAADANQALIINAPRLYAEVMRLREAIEGYKAIWDYLDPKGYAWEEEEFVALLKEHGFEVGEEE